MGTMRRCDESGCERKHYGRGKCQTHYMRLWHGSARIGPIRAKAPDGAGTVLSTGYRRIGRQREHRLVMVEHIGRPLTPDEHVHHINEDKLDNRIENLRVMSRSEHTAFHNRVGI